MSKKTLSKKSKKSNQTPKEFDDYGQGIKLGNDFSLIVIMVALIFFCLSSWIGFNQLSKSLDKKSVTPSIPAGQPVPTRVNYN